MYDRNNGYGYDFFNEDQSTDLKVEEIIDKKIAAIRKKYVAISVLFIIFLGFAMVSITTISYNNLANGLKKDYADEINKISTNLISDIVNRLEYQYQISDGRTDVGSVVWNKNSDAIMEVYCYQSAYADSTSDFSATASAFIINEDGYLITNAHVVTYEKMTGMWGGRTQYVLYGKILGRFKDADVMYELSVEAYDIDLDLAVLKLKELPSCFSYVTFMDSDCVVMGQSAVVIGNAEGLGISVATGTVTNIGIVNDSQEYIQTDAAVNHGNSGGPIFNATGYCMGVVTSKISEESSDGIGFAIHSNQVMEYIDTVNNGKNLNIKYYLYSISTESEKA